MKNRTHFAHRIDMLLAIRSEPCRDVQVNLAYRWFCGLSIEDKIPDHSAFSRARHERFRDSDWSAVKGSRSMRA
jgi:hypothetical protein